MYNDGVRYIAGVAAMTTVPPDFPVALHYFGQAKAMIDAFREYPDFEVYKCAFKSIFSTLVLNLRIFISLILCLCLRMVQWMNITA